VPAHSTQPEIRLLDGRFYAEDPHLATVLHSFAVGASSIALFALASSLINLRFGSGLMVEGSVCHLEPYHLIVAVLGGLLVAVDLRPGKSKDDCTGPKRPQITGRGRAQTSGQRPTTQVTHG